ncbi:MAG: hypothetical protein FWG49_03205, partial [Leptospirales bacterium]|nr:hypothetical protein [Leptospirales bacterium]
SILMLLFLGLSCFTGQKTDWDNIPDKRFYFTQFQYAYHGSNKDKALQFFKNFPVKKIIYLIAKEYNIEIDIIDFNNFIKSSELSQIESQGLIRAEKQTWNSNKSKSNKIVFIFEQDNLANDRDIKFTIAISSEDKELRTIKTTPTRIDFIFKQLEFSLKSSKENAKEYDEKNLAAVSLEPMVIEDQAFAADKEDLQDKLKEIKSKINDYVNQLNQDQKKEFKHDIIDYIYKTCGE